MQWLHLCSVACECHWQQPSSVSRVRVAINSNFEQHPDVYTVYSLCIPVALLCQLVQFLLLEVSLSFAGIGITT